MTGDSKIQQQSVFAMLDFLSWWLLFFGGRWLLAFMFVLSGNDERSVCKLCCTESLGNLRWPATWADPFAYKGSLECFEEVHLWKAYSCTSGKACCSRGYAVASLLLSFIFSCYCCLLLFCLFTVTLINFGEVWHYPSEFLGKRDWTFLVRELDPWLVRIYQWFVNIHRKVVPSCFMLWKWNWLLLDLHSPSLTLKSPSCHQKLLGKMSNVPLLWCSYLVNDTSIKMVLNLLICSLE